MVKTLLIGFFLSFSLSEGTPVHALHLSTFEINYTPQKEHSTARLRVFQDDFRDAIKNANPNLSMVSNELFLNTRKDQIERYFQQHLQLIFDSKNSSVLLIDSQAENDVYWFYFDIVFPKKWQKCSLRADYLMELFEDQSNIGTVILNDEKLFFRFTQEEVSFQFESLN